MANTVVSPVIEKVVALLAQESLYPQMKKKVGRLQDKFSLISSFLRELGSEELDSRGMAWMEELCDLSRSTVDVIGLFINQREHLSRSWRGLLRRVLLAFYNFKC